MEGKHGRGDASEQGIKADPKQQERRPSREVLLRYPKAEEELEEPGNQPKPPHRVDRLAHDRANEVERPLEDQEQPEHVSNGHERTDGVDEGPYGRDEKKDAKERPCQPQLPTTDAAMNSSMADIKRSPLAALRRP